MAVAVIVVLAEFVVVWLVKMVEVNVVVAVLVVVAEAEKTGLS